MTLRAPYLDDGDVRLYVGDCIEVMQEMDAESVDAVVCDPPYGLEFMGKDWDAPWKACGAVIRDPATERGGFQDGNGGNPYSRSRIEYGRGGQASSDFAAWCETWAREALRVLKPGGHLLAFGGTRTFHRLTCGIEDAGFEVRDCLSWLYGSGFPKSLDVSKAIDKSDARDEQRDRRLRFTDWVRSQGVTARQIDAATHTNMGGHYTTAESQPAIMTREHLEACRHLFADVPAWVEAEADKRTVESRNMAAREVVGRGRSAIANKNEGKRHTVGASAAVEFDLTAPATDAAREWQGWGTALKPAWEPCVVARKPLAGTVAENVQQHGTGALNVDGCRIGRDPDDVSGWATTGSKASDNRAMSGGNTQRDPKPDAHGRWPANVALDEDAAAMLDAQSGERKTTSTYERGAGVDSVIYGPGVGKRHAGEMQIGYGDIGGASRFFYTAKASRADRNAGGMADNTHPTVKPTDLMRWLVRMVTPPGGIVLDPFAGSGSTLVAARAEGVRAVGIEREDEYARIIADRLAQLSLFSEGMDV